MTATTYDDRYWSCERKVRWCTEQLANNWAWLIALARGFDPIRGPLTSYACRYCDGYHVGHSREA